MAAPLMSMTGFGAGRGEADWGSWSVEVKSVNGKSLDVRVNTPPGFDVLDRHAKAEATKRFKRGNIQVAVRIEPAEGQSSAQVNEALLDQLIGIAKSHKEGPMGRLGHEAMAALLNVRGVVEVSSVDLRALAGEDDVVETLKRGVVDALEALFQSRRSEGQAQTTLFSDLLSDFRRTLDTCKSVALAQPGLLKTRLETQLAELDATDKVDAERLAAEITLSAAKADVREELDRLSAHFDSAQTMLDSGVPIGRKLEFLSQEIGREANTLCSKSASIELTNAGLALKALNDQFKEQAANVE
ncbi:MAG: YicC/YloC family endoribonuclease [Pseudomonadota bacterium]